MVKNKLQALRAEMQKRGIDGFFIPRADAFQGEYVPAANERLAWITGFTGSAGSAVVLNEGAAFFTDGRYTLQAQNQVDATCFNLCSVSENQHPIPTTTPTQWIEKNLKQGAVFGIDPWIHTPNDEKRIRAAVEKAGGTLVHVQTNPLDAAWADRPAMPASLASSHPLKFSGVGSADKCRQVADILKKNEVKALAIMLPEDICWLLNVRGDDVPHTPFVLSYAVLHDDASVDWYVDACKITDDMYAWLGENVRVHVFESFAADMAGLARQGSKIWIDPAASPVRLRDVIIESGGGLHEDRNPIQLLKAQKNTIEVQGSINAHIRDGVAVVRFLSALSEQGAASRLDEISASDMLEGFRREGTYFKDLSFDTISGAGPNGAVIHYRAQEETKLPLTAGPVYLVDSGGQYLDGTTDITRTIALDNVTPEMQDRFTRVLIGHIRLAMAVFPEGTTGDVLDVLARSALKEAGLDYAHGTGHGVGSYLSVHEGPCGISPLSKTVPLMPGMILSNEPGYYKPGAYGIRIENLVVVEDTGKKDSAGRRLFGFKTLTLAPIDRNLILPAMLLEAEREWLNAYHALVCVTLLPLLQQGKDVDYLRAATAKI